MTATFQDSKSVEAARIGPLLGAISALPASALVFRADAGPGAPLLLLAIVLSAAAYVFWITTDAVFEHHYLHQEAGWTMKQLKPMERRGGYMSWMTVMYGGLSLLLTTGGFAAIFSTVRTPVSIDVGMIVALVVAAAVFLHCCHAFRLRNLLIDDDYLSRLLGPPPG